MLTVLLVAIAVATYTNVHVNDSTKVVRQALVTGRTQALVSIDSQLLSVITLLVFLVGVGQVLGRTEGGLSVLTLLWVTAGAVLVAVIIVWQAAYAAAVLTAPYIATLQLKLLIGLSNVLDQVTPLPVGIFVGAASVLTLQSRIFPRWTGWLGATIAMLSVVAVLDMVHVNSPVSIANPIALLLWLIWTLAVSISLLRRAD